MRRVAILHRERAAGVHPELLAFLDWWEAHGIFDLTICRDGGVRTDESKQALFYSSGASKARTLSETPHGRGGALDVAPVIAGIVPWGDEQKFRVIGICAEHHGLQWGGRFPRPDLDHLQVSAWRTLPFPPQPFPPPEVA